MATVSELKQAIKQATPLDDLLMRPARFDADVWHVMQARDEQLIRDSVLHGTIIKDYVYSFSIKGQTVTGISVVGARQLAVEYKGIKSRLVGSAEKTGSMFVFRSFDPMSINVQHIPELGDEPDYYECILEISDIKTGNSIQVRKKENRQESKRDGTLYERPHYDVIAESKAFRNGVLSIIPQSVVAEFEQKALKSGNGTNEKTIEQRREELSAYAAKHGIKVDRNKLANLTYSEISGLAVASQAGKAAFIESLTGIGIISERQETVNTDTGEITPQESADTPETYPDWRVKIADCKTIGEIAHILNEMPKEVKSELKDALRAKQTEINNREAK